MPFAWSSFTALSLPARFPNPIPGQARFWCAFGKSRDGGAAERIVVPVMNAVPVPDGVPFEHAAVMMCSTATAYHALRLAAVPSGATVAIIGFGGLGVSALQLAQTLGSERVAALDVVPEKLARAASLGAVSIDAASPDLSNELRQFAGTHGIDDALDFSGQPETTARVLAELAPHGRLVLVTLSRQAPHFDPYRDLAAAVSATVPLEAEPVNAALGALERGTASLRSVILF